MNPSSTRTVQIERALPGDFLAIAALDRVAWQQNLHSEFIPDGEHAWRIWCEHALTFVGRAEEGRLAGVILAFPCLNGTFCLHKVMVDESCRGQGLGFKLFSALFAELDRKQADCFLTVDPVNENAIKLYRKWGFLQEEFVSGFYREQEDRLVLTRQSKASL